LPNYTTNYNLKKPLGTENYNVEDQNGNMDIIDTQIKSLNNNKVDKVTGKGLSTNDYTNTDKAEVDKISLLSGASGVNEKLNKSTFDSYKTTNDSSLADKMPKSGGTFTGAITTVNGVYGLKIGDDAEMGDNNVSNTAFLRGQQDDNQGYLRMGNATFSFGWNGSSYGINNNVIFTQETYGAVSSISASFTLGLGDANRVITAWNTAAIAITIPNDTTANLPIGSQITVYRGQTGTITFAPAGGVTLNSKDTKRSIDGQHASATLIKLAANVWALIGALM
jgi:hypothetical protein